MRSPTSAVSLTFCQSQGLVTRSSKDGQVKALARVLDAGAAPDSFRPAAWHLISGGNGQFVLGDSCVVARAEDGSLGSLMKAGKKWREIYLPISPRQVLAATSTQTGQSLDNAAINRASAKFALRYIYRASGSGHSPWRHQTGRSTAGAGEGPLRAAWLYASCTGPETDDLQTVIGTGEPLISQDQAAKIMKEAGTRTPSGKLAGTG